MRHAPDLSRILATDPLRWRILGLVRSLGLPDGWVGAGFVRDAVWDHLHGRSPVAPAGDVDVVWFAPDRAAPGEDRRIEGALRAMDPSVRWSVKNQARMHRRNGDPPYASTLDAIRFWPETATAVAVRRSAGDACAVAAPFGLEDLFGLVLRPAPRFRGERFAVVADRARSKGWLARWPLLRPPPEEAAFPAGG
jgi:hypothetical protein